MKKLLSTLALMLAVMTAAAQTFTVGNLSFTVTDADAKTVSVKKAGDIEGQLVIPSTVTNEGVAYTVTSVAGSAFSGTAITSVSIPASVLNLGNYSFSNCASLAIIRFEDSDNTLTMHTNDYYNPFQSSGADKTVYIGRNVNVTYSPFSNVTSVEIGGKMTTINNNLFSGNVKLANITIGNSVTTIGTYAFYNTGTDENIGEQTVTMGSNVTTIGGWAFNKCAHLYSITLPDVLTTMGESAFNATGLTSVTIPASVKSLGNYAFAGCASLAEIKIEDADSVLTMHTNDYYNPFKDSNADKAVYIGRNVNVAYKLFNNVTSVELGGKMTTINSNLFRDNAKLASITIGNSVTTIGTNAFYNTGTDENNGEQTVAIGSNVTTIGGWAFNKCPHMYSVTLPDVLTTIGESAFNGTGLTSITIPASVESLGDYAFRNCTSLAEINIEDTDSVLTMNTNGYYNPFQSSGEDKTVYLGRNIAKIDYSPFSNVTSVEIGDKVTTINNSLFSGNAKLASITIGNGVTSIGSYAFQNTGTDENIGEQTVTMGSNVTSIGYCAFYNCPKMLSVTLPDELTTIAESAFNKTGLTSITIPASVKSLGNYAFAGCASLAEIKIEDTDSVLTMTTNEFYRSFKDSNADKTVYLGRNVNVSYNMFSNVTSLEIGDKVTAINNSLFDGNTKLASITIGNGVTSIGSYAFRNTGTDENIGEQTVTMGSNVTSIGYCAFNNCPKMQSVTLPNVLTTIDESAFNATGLTSITIPASVKSLGNYAFAGCASLAEIKIEDTDSVLTMTTNEFYRPFKDSNADKTVYLGRNVNVSYNMFSNVTSLEIGDKVTAINNNLFRENAKLASITIGNGVTTIGSAAFYNTGTDEAIGEQTVNMGSNVTLIDNYAFQACSKMQSITLPAVLKKINYCAFDGSGLTSITIPASVESLGDYAFASCASLAEIIIEDADSVLTMTTNDYYRPFKSSDAEKTVYLGRNVNVSYNMFSNLTDLEIGKKVTEIKSNLFNTSTLTNVKTNWLEPIAITDNVFNNTTYQNGTLWVPSRTDDLYREAAGWKKFMNMGNGSFFVSVEAEGHGTLAVADITAAIGETVSTYIDRNTDITFTATADKGYKLTALTINGEAVQAVDGSFTVGGLAADQEAVATFAPITYTLKYNLAGGALPEGKTNPATYTIESQTITLVAPERAGYTFEGWTGTDLENPTKTVTIAKGSTGNRSYTATWKVIAYTISYDLAGGVLPQGMTNPTAYNVESNAITLINPVRAGYTFEGWTGTGLQEPTKTVTIAKGSTGNRSYKANWKVIAYTISYDLAGGVLPQGMTNPTAYNVESQTFTLINPIRERYEFTGWTGTGLQEPTFEVTITKGSMGNRSYTATWVLKEKCDVNGDGTVDVADIATVISVMAGSAEQFNEAADTNGDGTVDVADIATVISRMAELSRLAKAVED